MDTILVIGSNSPTGASFCAHALGIGFKVIATSRSKELHDVFLPYKWKDAKGLTFEKVDLNYNMDVLEGLIMSHRPKYILNFASQGMVAQSWGEPTHWMQTNVVATTALLEILRNLDFLERYIHFTTPEVYGSTPDWISENRNYAPSYTHAPGNRPTCLVREYRLYPPFRRHERRGERTVAKLPPPACSTSRVHV